MLEQAECGRGWSFRRVLALALALLWNVAAAAPPPENLRFDSLTIDQGLSQDSVTAIAQDQQGFMWLGTQSGLNRYDGYRAVVYKHEPANPASLVDNFVQTLYEDAQGRLWIGTRGGLDRYDPATNSFTHLQLPAAPGRIGARSIVFAIVSDGAEGLWIGTSDGLHHINLATATFDRSLQHGDSADSLSDDRVQALALDAAGNLWIGTAAGLNRLPANAAKVRRDGVDGTAAVVRGGVRALHVDYSGQLWIGLDDGVARLALDGNRRGELHRFDATEGVTDTGRVFAVFQDREGNIWVGSDNGVWCADAQARRFRRYRHYADDPHSLVDDRIASLFQDRTGTLWIGTWYGGASRADLASGGFERYRHYIQDPQSLSSSQVSGVEVDDHGGAWLAVLDGLDRLDLASGEVTAVYRHDPRNPASLRSGGATAVRSDSAGRLWVGTTEGLDRFDAATGQFVHIDLKTADPRALFVEAIYRDPAGILWVPTRGGVHRIDPVSGDVQTLRSDPADPGSLSDPEINAVHVDRHGTLWIATSGGGLDRRLPGADRFEHFLNDPKDPDSISHSRVQAFLEDRSGTLWVGTAEGLNRVLPGADGSLRFKRYTTSDGLGADSIGEIQEDDSGRLWISTTAGISRFDPVSGRFQNYSARDGLVEGSFFIGSSARDAAGRLYFGGLSGLTVFQPRDIRDNPYPPQVAITDFLIFNRSERASPQSLSAARTFSYRESVFSFEFSALHFADPQRNRYAYKLDGFDHDWVETDAGNRYATYTNLEPGKYVFRVRAANKDGVWGEAGISIPITITPPFWKTWWFRGLAAILLLGSAYAFYRYRIRSLIRQRWQLEQQVDERTAEVMRQKEMVEQQKEMVEQQKDELQKAYRAVEEASLTDPLTGLRNRRFLQQHLDVDSVLTIRRCTAALAKTGDSRSDPEADLLFFLIDIDHFKTVNDRHGHAAGDQVLVETAARLQRLVRESDYVVRWGGEEFLLVARGTSRSQAERIAERIRAVVAASPFALEGGVSLPVSCSVGFACFPFMPAEPRLMTWIRVIDLADHALYAAKRRGRNTWAGLLAHETVRSASLLERLMRSTQQAIYDGEVKLVSPEALAPPPEAPA